MSHRLQIYTDIREFSDSALPFLLVDEAVNNLQVGLVHHSLMKGSLAFRFMATVRASAGEVVGVLTLTPGHSLVLSKVPPAAHEAVSRDLANALPNVHALMGPPDTVAPLGRLLAHRLHATATPSVQMGVLEVRNIQPPRPAPGRSQTTG